MTRRPLGEKTLSSRVIAVLRADTVERLAPVCDVLVEEGIVSLEFTMTTPGILDALPTLVGRYGAVADVGLGTVTTPAQASAAIDAGVGYLVTPALYPAVIDLAVRGETAILPGGLTPTELAAGWEAGAAAVKIFPAQTVGPEYLRHLHGPFPELIAIPSGGVDVEAAGVWLTAGAAAVSIGGPLLGDALSGGDPAALRRRCAAVRSAAAP
ncbi:bifunctional 4-hydroxy-2-oxoglutarate aldolase/2-dehydro-3-deoxy-phosphogluconate aldolase [Actinoplanes sp. NBRC 101535]|uniref:bifunctional 4-hydroxy-2-oxoglutarate aldolase/2-dehydro-3-deoxy-phosphogluconate aldolase n=1 Tax=Actinoplanes sp. NBRC 101535 TaxID=3032196 RepID=UPI0024A45EAE|nr:bifunctional 4-hydroxy-2-oxoglutarate aldolase/2-dehydro-3-deoxy-phosphogluconate aldolase [Actinoplanes sp. NBRC 101535]GLY02395.1 2-keto-3-deoxy-phosphogluconate aldolase [Actinoplanes sp. NBRC 101535]